jgi:DNA-binding GntR family transcriptional regulator
MTETSAVCIHSLMDSYGKQLITEHHEIVRAIRSGDAQAARERAADTQNYRPE